MALGIISEYVVVFFMALALAVCFVAWFKYNEYESLGYIVPIIIFIILYSLFAVYDPPDEFRRAWVRLILSGLAIDIAIWRIVYIIRRRK